jgi:hypothetical protein
MGLFLGWREAVVAELAEVAVLHHDFDPGPGMTVHETSLVSSSPYTQRAVTERLGSVAAVGRVLELANYVEEPGDGMTVFEPAQRQAGPILRGPTKGQLQELTPGRTRLLR